MLLGGVSDGWGTGTVHFSCQWMLSDLAIEQLLLLVFGHFLLRLQRRCGLRVGIRIWNVLILSLVGKVLPVWTFPSLVGWLRIRVNDTCGDKHVLVNYDVIGIVLNGLLSAGAVLHCILLCLHFSLDLLQLGLVEELLVEELKLMLNLHIRNLDVCRTWLLGRWKGGNRGRWHHHHGVVLTHWTTKLLRRLARWQTHCMLRRDVVEKGLLLRVHPRQHLLAGLEVGHL